MQGNDLLGDVCKLQSVLTTTDVSFDSLKLLSIDSLSSFYQLSTLPAHTRCWQFLPALTAFSSCWKLCQTWQLKLLNQIYQRNPKKVELWIVDRSNMLNTAKKLNTLARCAFGNVYINRKPQQIGSCHSQYSSARKRAFLMRDSLTHLSAICLICQQRKPWGTKRFQGWLKEKPLQPSLLFDSIHISNAITIAASYNHRRKRKRSSLCQTFCATQ